MRVGLWLAVSLVVLRAAFGKEAEVTTGGNIKQSASKARATTSDIYEAAAKSDVVFKGLIDAGANLETADNKYGLTALMVAASYGHADAMSRLIEAGANLEAADNKHGMTALIFAAVQGHTHAVKRLIKAGANLEAADKGGETALLHAAFTGHTDVMNRLIMAGAKREAAENLDDPSIPVLYWDDTKRKVVEKKCAHCRSFFRNR
uniref:Ankyrin repeat domain-containing protein n=1 Tax=Florenciella parvula TaxID=236787 RepID=A0A7S2D5D4_9STRA|mmetsp:Transcript_9417/g.19909  ORF Transcript_9417/g.19909 Transcript_9417/m.19909 type:complete len:205 (+) Transcript_9417:104-718(+)